MRLVETLTIMQDYYWNLRIRFLNKSNYQAQIIKQNSKKRPQIPRVLILLFSLYFIPFSSGLNAMHFLKVIPSVYLLLWSILRTVKMHKIVLLQNKQWGSSIGKRRKKERVNWVQNCFALPSKSFPSSSSEFRQRCKLFDFHPRRSLSGYPEMNWHSITSI